MNLHWLVGKIEKRFDMRELHTLCFSLDIKFENIPGDTLQDKSRELVQYCKRHNRLDELIKACKENRPTVSWEPDNLDNPSHTGDGPNTFLVLELMVGVTLLILILLFLKKVIPAPLEVTATQTPTLNTAQIATAIVTPNLVEQPTNPPVESSREVTKMPTSTIISSPVEQPTTIPTETSTGTTETLPPPTDTLPTMTVPTLNCSAVMYESFFHINSSPDIPEVQKQQDYAFPEIKPDFETGNCVLDFSDAIGQSQILLTYNHGFEPENGTIEIIVKELKYPPAGSLSGHYLVAQSSQLNGNGINVYSILIDNQGRLLAHIYDDTGLKQYFTEPAAIKLNCWNHIAVTWNEGTLEIFIDGKLSAQGVYAPVPGKGLLYHDEINYNPQVGLPFYGDFDGQVAGVYFFDSPRTLT